MPLVEYDSIGRDWVLCFISRHSELASITPRSIDAVPIKDILVERLQRWFADVDKVITEYHIKPKHTYNMHETGFAIGEKEAGRYIINAQIHQKYQAKPGRQEWVSVVEYIGADGTVIPSLVILKAEKLSPQ